jgi:hypothetical protein
MTKIERLKREAKDAATWRGHTLRTYITNRSNGAAYTTCKHCLAWVAVKVKPLPNEIDIGGSAVAINCSKQGE